MTLTQTVTWIPCAERLPERAGWYLVATDFETLITGFYYKGVFTRDLEGIERFTATHWSEQPLKHPAELEGRA